MARQKRLMVALTLLTLGVTSTGFAAGPIDFEVTADFFSKYLWRGQNLSDDEVFQTGVSAAYKGFTASVWGNMDLTSVNGNAGHFSEVDYALDYSAAFPGLEGVGYSVGVIFYDFPGTAVPDTTEVYWGLAFDLPLNPSITVYHDIDEAEGTYASLGLGHTFEDVFEIAPGVPVSVDLGASFGYASGSYNKYYWGTDQAKTQDLGFSVGFPFELGPVSVTPSLNYVTLVSDDIRDTDVYDDDSDYFFAGVSLAYAF